jgi:hypothetical protein
MTKLLDAIHTLPATTFLIVWLIATTTGYFYQ